MRKIIKNREKLFVLLKGTTKKRIHFNSLMNITDVLIDENNKRIPDYLILLLDEYYKLIVDDLDVNKIDSLNNYNKYILPCSVYLVSNYGFLSMYSLWRFVVLGIVMDCSVFLFVKYPFFHYLPVFTLVLFSFGFIKRILAKRNNKYVAFNW